MIESGRKLLAVEQADITRADTIKFQVVKKLCSPDWRSWVLPPEAMHAPALYRFSAQRGSGDVSVLLVSRRTVLVIVTLICDWICEPVSEQNEE